MSLVHLQIVLDKPLVNPAILELMYLPMLPYRVFSATQERIRPEPAQILHAMLAPLVHLRAVQEQVRVKHVHRVHSRLRAVRYYANYAQVVLIPIS